MVFVRDWNNGQVMAAWRWPQGLIVTLHQLFAQNGSSLDLL